MLPEARLDLIDKILYCWIINLADLITRSGYDDRWFLEYIGGGAACKVICRGHSRGHA